MNDARCALQSGTLREPAGDQDWNLQGMIELMIRSAVPEDAERLLEIYAYYVSHTAISFEYEPPSAAEFRRRIENTLRQYPYLVLEEEGAIQGYVYAGVFKGRAAYARSCEVSIYVDRHAKGHGYGRKLYEALEEKLKAQGILNLYACIADPIAEDEYLTRNSELFHQHLGYRKVGDFHRCAFKFNRWYNMIWMEKMIGEHKSGQIQEAAKKKCALFDLDGTLLDTSPGIVESVQYAAEKLGYPQLSREQLLRFIGPPLQSSFMKYYACSREEADALTAAYREHYRGGALLRATPYPGIFELCGALREAGLKTMVATSKPQPFAEQILAHFGFSFDAVHGVDFAGKLGKADMIRLCAADAGLEAQDCVMIGDTEHDARGAQEAGAAFIGVSYGFGDSAAMAAYPMAGMADSPMDVLRILGEGQRQL